MIDTSEGRRRHITNFSNNCGHRLKFITSDSNNITKTTGILCKTGTGAAVTGSWLMFGANVEFIAMSIAGEGAFPHNHSPRN
jgi:hypothetical protein